MVDQHSELVHSRLQRRGLGAGQRLGDIQAGDFSHETRRQFFDR